MILPDIIGLQETTMNHFLCIQPCLDRIVEILEGAKIKALPFKTDVNAVTVVFHLIDAAEAAGVIFSVLSVFQDLYTGAVDDMKLACNVFLVFCLETAAAFIISMYQFRF